MNTTHEAATSRAAPPNCYQPVNVAKCIVTYTSFTASETPLHYIPGFSDINSTSSLPTFTVRDSPDESPDRNGKIQLMQKPRVEDLRAASELSLAMSMIRLQRKPRNGDLRAAAAEHSLKDLHLGLQALTVGVHKFNISY
jgi:hypothetical protein